MKRQIQIKRERKRVDPLYEYSYRIESIVYEVYLFVYDVTLHTAHCTLQWSSSTDCGGVMQAASPSLLLLVRKNCCVGRTRAACGTWRGSALLHSALGSTEYSKANQNEETTRIARARATIALTAQHSEQLRSCQQRSSSHTRCGLSPPPLTPTTCTL